MMMDEREKFQANLRPLCSSSQHLLVDLIEVGVGRQETEVQTTVYKLL